MTVQSSSPVAPLNRGFALAWRSLAHSRVWPFLLLALGTASNIVYAHTPLVAFAVLSGVSLPRRRAITVALGLWLINQTIGFGMRGYPLTAIAFTWGALMGLGTLLVVSFAMVRPAFSQSAGLGHGLWVLLAVLVGFVLNQGLIMLAYPLLAEGNAMGWDIIARQIRNQLLWAGAISLIHGALLWRQTSLHPAQT
ncbi:MAG: hypothetical protein ACFB0C_05990 [Leptolyngbyaceae cyanobacterium]